MTLVQLSKSLIVTLTVPALMLASTALAAGKERRPIKSTDPAIEKPQSATSTQTGQQERMATPSQSATDILRISDIMEMTVENTQGNNLGEIKDVVIDPSDGSIAYAVLAAGGFLGLGEKYFAIPWSAFQTVAAEGEKYEIERLLLDVDKERMQNAPGFDKGNWPDMANAQWGESVHSYYDQQDQWERRQAMRRGGVSATVQQIRGNTVELQVPQSMMQDLQAGDQVEVSLQKQTKTQPAQPSQSQDKEHDQERDMGSKSKN